MISAAVKSQKVASLLVEGAESVMDSCLTVPLPYMNPYRYDLLIEFLRFRAIKGVEVVDQGVYARTFQIGSDCGWIAVEDDEVNCRVLLTISPELAEHTGLLVEKARRLFDIDCDPVVVQEKLAGFFKEVDPKYKIEGIRLPSSFSPFEMGARAIIGQQITVKAANTLAGRIAEKFGIKQNMAIRGLEAIFPGPEAFASEEAVDTLGELGVIRSRGNAIRCLAQGILDGTLQLEPGQDAEAAYKSLVALPGIGPWTANYMLMRALHHTDGFPAADYGVKLAFPGLKPKEIERMSTAWSPYRSYAVMCMWSPAHD